MQSGSPRASLPAIRTAMRMSRKTVKQRSVIHTKVKAPPDSNSEALGIPQESKQQESRDSAEVLQPPDESTEDAALSAKQPVRHKYARQWGKHKILHPEKYYEGWESDECPLEAQGAGMPLASGPHQTTQQSYETSSGLSATTSTSGLSSPNTTGVESPKSRGSSFSARRKVSLFRPYLSSSSSSTASLPKSPYSPKLPTKPRKAAKLETQSSPPESAVPARATHQKRTMKVQPVVVLMKIESIELDSSSGDDAEQALQQLRSAHSARSSRLLLLSLSRSENPSLQASPNSTGGYLMETAEALASTKSLVKRRTGTFSIPHRLFRHT